MDDAEQLIRLLTEFPGMTQTALVQLHDIAPSLIYRCVEQELIRCKVDVVGTRSGNHHVFRFYAK
jgi:hypothetical protein